VLLEPLTEKEIEFMECWNNPTALTECLIPENIKAPHLWKNEDCKLVEVRNYQVAMQNYSYMYANDDRLKPKQNFQLKKGAGRLINIASRNIGKSYLGLIIDAFLTLLHGEADESCVGSFDHKHLMKVCKPIGNLANYHPFFKIFKRKGKSNVRFSGGGMEIDTMLGHTMYGKNEQVEGNDPGTDFHGLHFKTFYYEEASYMSKLGTEKRIDSGHSEGYIERLSGIPDIRIDSPLGGILMNPKNKPWICRVPQYIRCIAEDSKILMADFSTKNIQDVEIGDEIFSVTENKPHFLKKAIVTNKNFSGYKNVITINNGKNNLDLTSDHKMLTKLSPMYRNWKSFDELKDCYEIYYFDNYIKDMKSYFEGVFLGFLETEGSFKRNGIEKSIGQKVEKDGLEWLLNFLNFKFTKYPDKVIKDFYYFYLSTQNNFYIENLYKKLEISRDVQLGFLAGCIYGDGCVHYSKETRYKDITLNQKNKCKIIDHVLNLAEINHIKRKLINKTQYGVFDGYQYSFKKTTIPLCLPFSKKSKNYRDLWENSTLASITHDKVKKIGNSIKPTWDLTTTCKSFVANGFLVHNCDWDEVSKAEAIEKYNGETSMAYKLNVLGEIIEGAQGFWDMERLRKMTRYGKTGTKVKFFEVDKNRFYKLDQILIIDRLPCKQCYICSDIGTTGSPSEIIIIFYDGEKYKYHYNIALYKLTTSEQSDIFEWIYNRMGGAFIALDCSNADGRSIMDDLRKKGLPESNLLEVNFQKNIEVDFLKDEHGCVLTDKQGEPLMKEERVKDWSIVRLEKLIYGGLLEIPKQEKFIENFSNLIVKQQKGNKRIFGSLTGEDHLHQSFECFAICQFYYEFKQQVATPRPKRCLGTFKSKEN